MTALYFSGDFPVCWMTFILIRSVWQCGQLPSAAADRLTVVISLPYYLVVQRRVVSGGETGQRPDAYCR